MNQAATTKEELLAISLELAAGAGFEAINIREVADRAGISVGCVYHYFPSKAELVAATVEKVWEGIFHKTEKRESPADFIQCVEWMYESIRKGSKDYPALLSTHAAFFSAGGRDAGRRVMNKYIGHIKDGMLSSLLSDRGLRQDAFDSAFRPEEFVDFVFDSLVMLCSRPNPGEPAAGQGEPGCSFLCALIRRLIY